MILEAALDHSSSFALHVSLLLCLSFSEFGTARYRLTSSTDMCPGSLDIRSWVLQKLPSQRGHCKACVTCSRMSSLWESARSRVLGCFYCNHTSACSPARRVKTVYTRCLAAEPHTKGSSNLRSHPQPADPEHALACHRG